jgi:hypothetical protein
VERKMYMSVFRAINLVSQFQPHFETQRGWPC